MPEYHQIETYLDIRNTFEEAISNCASFFNELGWLNSDFRDWLSSVSWDVAEDFIVYSGTHGPTIENLVGDEMLKIRVIFLGWTPKAIPSLRNNCLKLELLIETEEIEDQTSWPQIKYLPKKSAFIWALMKKASNHFEDYGVFFTDEAQDGRPWKGIIENNETKKWQFDLAIVGDKYKALFIPSPPMFFTKFESNKVWLARRTVWEKPPWI